MVSTAAFQSGAREYAKSNRIGLVEVKRGNIAYICNSMGPTINIPHDADPYCGLMNMKMKNGVVFPMRLTSWDTLTLEEFLQDHPE